MDGEDKGDAQGQERYAIALREEESTGQYFERVLRQTLARQNELGTEGLVSDLLVTHSLIEAHVARKAQRALLRALEKIALEAGPITVETLRRVNEKLS